MTPHSPPSRRIRQQGFSLLEMMIAVVIGMFSVLVIMQVMSGTATSRRIAVGGGDAQLNGVAGMRALALDIEQAGLGLQSFNLLGCSLSYTTSGDSASVTLPALAPVVLNPASSVVPAGDANTDRLLVMSGNSPVLSEGDALTASTTGRYTVSTLGIFAVGDQVVAAPSVRSALPCALQLAQVTAVSAYAVDVSNGTAVPGGVVYNLGSAPLVRAYAVRNGDLTVCDYTRWNCGAAANTGNAAIWVPVAGNIVSMRAQYARDSSGISGGTSVMDGVVDTYDQATPGSGVSADPSSIPLQCRWARVIGLRLVLVARSQQFDKTLAYAGSPNAASATNVLPAAALPTWDGAAGAPVNLSGQPSWDRYRYTTTQTAIPLRNMIWQGGQPTFQGGAGAC